jgi:hypothetical protein
MSKDCAGVFTFIITLLLGAVLFVLWMHSKKRRSAAQFQGTDPRMSRSPAQMSTPGSPMANVANGGFHDGPGLTVRGTNPDEQ